MREWELEALVVEQTEAMEKAYDALLNGEPDAVQDLLADALDLHEGGDGNEDDSEDGDG